jgi:Rps23 Pro-64 3,4-dihydroxylase Tpa1-like proline 4-hydroxylase
MTNAGIPAATLADAIKALGVLYRSSDLRARSPRWLSYAAIFRLNPGPTHSLCPTNDVGALAPSGTPGILPQVPYCCKAVSHEQQESPGICCILPRWYVSLELMSNWATEGIALRYHEFAGLSDWLPVARLREVGLELHRSYLTAEPYPHAVIDDLFDPELLRELVARFPNPKQVKWQEFNDQKQVKLASSRDETFDPVCRVFLYHLNSGPFLDFLSELTGIPGLIADSHFAGGGMHQIERGGKLAIHADFNKHPVTDLDRRLNVLLYLNENWRDEYGGHFELWDRSMHHCVKKVAPLFNRLVVFSTTDISYHGHPDPLNVPPGVTRKSLALYYYSNGRPATEVSGKHSTLFKARPNDEFRHDSGNGWALARDLLPPALVRTIAKAKRGLR